MSRYPHLLIVLVLALPTIAVADRVTPNDRVDTRLRVREQPNTSSTIRGFLYPGESAEHEESVPYWYRVTLDDGTSGFVSKAYSRVVTTVPATQVLRLGSRNIKRLGHGSSKDYPLVAEII